MSVLPFVCPTTVYLCGPTGAGKTVLIFSLFKHQKVIFSPSPPSKILYCYGVYQKLFDQMEQVLGNIEFHKGLPTEEILVELTKGGSHTILVLDDLQSEAINSEFVEKIFTVYSHHKNCTIFIINQVLFPKGKVARTLALNSHYLLLCRNPREVAQITQLGQRVFGPGKGRKLSDIFNDCTKNKPYTYLLLDLSPHTDDKFRIRTNIIPPEDTIIYHI